MKNQVTGLAELFRSKSGQILASLMYFSRDLQLAEDALQDAFELANLHWNASRVPDNPAAWLHVVAKRKLIDKLRQRQSHSDHQKRQQISQSLSLHSDEQKEVDHDVPDERLRLIFTCCHPALNEPAQVALTLRTLCGLSVREIARAYLASEVSMGQRITRAKKKIRDAGIAYQVPDREQLPSRLPSVLKVIYLIYNESYSAYEGQSLTRQGLANEAIRLAYLMIKLLPNAEVYGLAALIVSHNARRLSRQSASESFIPLESQNRSQWDSLAIEKAAALINKALEFQQPGPYQIQAAISMLHNQAKTWQDTDWPQILLLYKSLHRLSPSPIVALNLHFAKAHGGQVEQAYIGIQELADALDDYQPYHAARAEVETIMGLNKAACVSLEKAIKISKNGSERDFLKRKHLALIKQLGR